MVGGRTIVLAQNPNKTGSLKIFKGRGARLYLIGLLVLESKCLANIALVVVEIVTDNNNKYTLLRHNPEIR